VRKAFTLIELAIVVVVLGILVSGIVAGQSIIRSANTNATINEIQKMGTAIRAFQLEFDATPGTMQDAYDYFGDECGSDSFDRDYGCNGEEPHDRCIDSSLTNCYVGYNYTRDVRRFFVHMNLSGIYPDLTYVPNTRDLPNCDIGTAFHEASIGGTYWVASEKPNKIYMYYFQPEDVTQDRDCRVGTWGDNIPPKIIKSIDEKIDEGNGRRGIIQAIDNPFNNNFNGTDCVSADGVYNLSNDDETCNIRAELQ
jgi:prepilin-type N-terminal cleavage/methylation domain-containing protein